MKVSVSPRFLDFEPKQRKEASFFSEKTGKGQQLSLSAGMGEVMSVHSRDEGSSKGNTAFFLVKRFTWGTRRA